MMRYDQILKLIDLFKPQHLVEIGTWNGENAIRMIQQAQRYHETVSYTGYDLFEFATYETDKIEFNVKPHNHADKIYDKLKEFCPKAEIRLVKGNTRETLPAHPAMGDFCYIDGGHSIETIASDYHYCKHIPIVVFDDYYIADAQGKCPDLAVVGCNRLVDSLPSAVVLPEADPVKGGGLTALVLRT